MGDWWAGGSLTRRPKGPFAVFWQRQIGEETLQLQFRRWSKQLRSMM